MGIGASGLVELKSGWSVRWKTTFVPVWTLPCYVTGLSLPEPGFLGLLTTSVASRLNCW